MCVATSMKADASGSGWGLQEEAAQPWLECCHRGAVMGAKAPPSDPAARGNAQQLTRVYSA